MAGWHHDSRTQKGKRIAKREEEVKEQHGFLCKILALIISNFKQKDLFLRNG